MWLSYFLYKCTNYSVRKCPPPREEHIGNLQTRPRKRKYLHSQPSKTQQLPSSLLKPDSSRVSHSFLAKSKCWDKVRLYSNHFTSSSASFIFVHNLLSRKSSQRSMLPANPPRSRRHCADRTTGNWNYAFLGPCVWQGGTDCSSLFTSAKYSAQCQSRHHPPLSDSEVEGWWGRRKGRALNVPFSKKQWEIWISYLTGLEIHWKTNSATLGMVHQMVCFVLYLFIIWPLGWNGLPEIQLCESTADLQQPVVSPN